MFSIGNETQKQFTMPSNRIEEVIKHFNLNYDRIAYLCDCSPSGVRRIALETQGNYMVKVLLCISMITGVSVDLLSGLTSRTIEEDLQRNERAKTPKETDAELEAKVKEQEETIQRLRLQKEVLSETIIDYEHIIASQVLKNNKDMI